MWAMNNKWQVMYKVMERQNVYIEKEEEKSAGMTIAKKKDTQFEKWSEIKVTHKNASFRPPCAYRRTLPAHIARISDIHLDCLSGQKKILV